MPEHGMRQSEADTSAEQPSPLAERDDSDEDIDRPSSAPPPGPQQDVEAGLQSERHALLASNAAVGVDAEGPFESNEPRVQDHRSLSLLIKERERPATVTDPPRRYLARCAGLLLVFCAVNTVLFLIFSFWRPRPSAADDVENKTGITRILGWTRKLTWPHWFQISEEESSTSSPEQAITTSVTTTTSAASCESVSGLVGGLSSSAMTASSQYCEGDGPSATLLTAHGWAAAAADARPWLEWDFTHPEALHPSLAIISKVKTAGRSFGQWVKKYILEYTDDNIRWTTVPQVFTGNVDKESAVENIINPPLAVYKLRMHIVDWYGAAATRVELVGCIQTMNVTLTTTSSTTTTTSVTTSSTTACMKNLTSRQNTSDGNWTSPSMFCWLLTQTNTEEILLVRDQKDKNLGIFTCEEHAVLSDESVPVGPDECSIPIGSMACGKGGWGSWVNSWVFVKAWETIADDGRYRSHDYIVKVDPDTVFFTDRLKAHIYSWPSDERWWLKNLAGNYPTVGALEVFSRAAMDAYAEQGKLVCDSWAHNSAEDEWICKCMSMFGAYSRQDLNALQHNKGDQCWNGNVAAFHPHKTVWSFDRCVTQAMR